MQNTPLTAGQLAELLGVAPVTIRKWVSLGWVKPDARTLGGHARFSRRTAEKLRRSMQKAAA